MKSKVVDDFLGQEMKITAQDTTFSMFKRRKDIKDYHFVTSESEVNFLSFKLPGSTFCFSEPQLKPRKKEIIVDYMVRWAGCIYQLKGLQVTLISIYQTVYSIYHGPASIYS